MHNQIPEGARLASRIIMIDQHKQVLYLKATEPKSGNIFWVMPGGGLEPDETFEDAAKREAFEETGCNFQLGQYVWYRRHKHIWNGKPFDQYERFYVAKVFDSTYKATNQDGYISDYKWFSLDQIITSNDVFVPRSIRNILGQILNEEYPDIPFDCGV